MRFEDLDDGQELIIKWIVGDVKKPVTLRRKGDRIWLKYGFNKKITEDIKTSFEGYKWHGFESPPVKQWSVKHSPHNWFQLNYFSGCDPYALYDKPLAKYEFEPRLVNGQWITPYEHQQEMTSHILTRHYCIIAGEMGVGKSLAAIMAMEMSGKKNWLWCAPRSALNSVQLECKKWNSKVWPEFCTYEGLKRLLEEWVDGQPVYDGVIFDEASRLKNPTAQRTIRAGYLAEHIRREHGPEGYVIPMSGSPAPKSPLDWYAQCEIACPGFLKEGQINIFKNNMAVIQKRESVTGGSYPQLITWRDDARKCGVCGEFEDHEYHNALNLVEGDSDEESPFHAYVKGVNEVARLAKRMKGLVLVKLKKDCVDLPDKIYRRIHLTPSKATIKAAKIIAAKASSTIKALTLLRQLSDGFQYTDINTGEETCFLCKGHKAIDQPKYIGPEKTWAFLAAHQAIPSWIDVSDTDNHPDDFPVDAVKYPQFYTFERQACPNCHGTGATATYTRTTDSIKGPKEDALRDILEDHEDIGRLVIFGGFTGTIDKCVEIVADCGWGFIRVDGRGWHSSIGGNALGQLEAFQNMQEQFPKLAFIGQPGAAGMGLTLTASPTTVYYSNDFNGESRIQSEDRIHRLGMNKTRGATIIDLIHLPTDEYVLDNLVKKLELQNMSLGDLSHVLKDSIDDVDE